MLNLLEVRVDTDKNGEIRFRVFDKIANYNYLMPVKNITNELHNLQFLFKVKDGGWTFSGDIYNEDGKYYTLSSTDTYYVDELEIYLIEDKDSLL